MFKRKGQSTLEYALIIAVVVGGLLLMQHYVRRGFAGRVRTASDDMGEQFDPYRYTANWTINQASNVEQTVDPDTRASRTEHNTAQTSLRTGGEAIGAYESSDDLFDAPASP
jgi:hypothetical protein